MPQLFAPGADAVLRFALMCAAVGVAVAVACVYGVANSDYVANVGIAPSQPAPFSHKHHSGELGIDCRYCHTSVEIAATAGIPPTYTCMTCHSQIWPTAGMLSLVRDSLAQNKPLIWSRVNRVPDYVYFNHSIHVSKGIGCSSCHGPVDQMQMTYRANALQMQFCLDCHRHPQQYLRKPDKVWNMEWTPPSDQATRGKELAAQYHIVGPARLTDCSICHR